MEDNDVKQVQFITHFTRDYSYLDSVRIALEGGCRWIQLRMKDVPDKDVYPVALKARQLCNEANATFIIDDRVRLVSEIQADGVHLGREDMPVQEAQTLLGNGFIIGGTANTFEDIQRLFQEGADYIGCGPFRFTTTKKKLSPILGLQGYRDIITKMKVARINLPVIAIGGITMEDIPALLQTGVSGIALSGTILRSTKPVETMKKVMKAVSSYQDYHKAQK